VAPHSDWAPGGNRLEIEADYSTVSNAEVENMWKFISTSPYSLTASWLRACYVTDANVKK